MYGLPQQTLKDRVFPECVTRGREPVLNMYEETKIVQHTRTMASYGYAYTMQECTDISTKYAVSLGKRTRNNLLTLRLMGDFRKRWSEVRVSNPSSIGHVRAKMTSEATVNSYFNSLINTFTNYIIYLINLTEYLIWMKREFRLIISHPTLFYLPYCCYYWEK